MKILILGDVGASKTNVEAFCDADEDLFSFDIQKLCKNADIILLNLEKPLTDIITPLGKCPPDYIAPTESINGIKLLNPTAMTLANNHILDQGSQGLRSTIKTLEYNNILYVGAGNNRKDASKPIIIQKYGLRVGVYACCEKEFSYATEDSPGANVFDPLETFDDIVSLKQKCDHLIILYHGGMQDYPFPTPYQQRVCRKMCDKGADLVVCQHSHIVGCQEKYGESLIIYGQGNLLLDEKDDDNWKTGLILEETIGNDVYDFRQIPVQTINHKVTIHNSYNIVLNNYNQRSKKIYDTRFVKDYYYQFCKKKLPDYLIKLSGKRRLFRRIINRLNITSLYSHILYGKDSRNILLDYLFCDSHREAIQIGLEDLNE